MKRLMKWVFLFALVFALGGCKSIREVEKPVYIHDTTTAYRELHDSTFIDRWHTEYVKGDTVYRVDSVYGWRYVYKRDTSWVYREVPVLQKVEVYRDKPLTKWQKFQQKGFWWLSVGLLGYILWRTRKWWLKIILRMS